MGFYKNTNSDIKQLKSDTVYPIGTIVRYKNVCGKVCSISDIKNWLSTNNPCSKYCVFEKYCAIDVPNICCSGTAREDHENIYFREVRI